jgi:hypothetical protein
MMKMKTKMKMYEVKIRRSRASRRIIGRFHVGAESRASAIDVVGKISESTSWSAARDSARAYFDGAHNGTIALCPGFDGAHATADRLDSGCGKNKKSSAKDTRGERKLCKI